MEKFVLLVAVLVLVASGVESKRTHTSLKGRSERWDNIYSHTRETRQAAMSSWYQKPEGCPIENVFQYDSLGRRQSGLLTPPEAQGCCGSCWAFASTHTFADNLNIVAGQRNEALSPEYTTRCANVINGCCGGGLNTGAEIIFGMGAATRDCLSYTLADYSKNSTESMRDADKEQLTCPRVCTDGTSAINPGNFRPVDGAFGTVLNLDEELLMLFLNLGPVVAGMETNDEFKYHYRCGVYETDSPSVFSEDSLKHLVEIVDYGTDLRTGEPIDFWVVKNSWGQGWGENGYFRIKRGGDLLLSNCGIGFFYNVMLSTALPTIVSVATDVSTCVATQIENPQNDNDVQSAVEFAFTALEGRVPCPDGSTGSTITLGTISEAMTQIVEGVMIEATVTNACIQGCGENVQATVDLEVYIDLDGAFELTMHDIQFNGGRAGTVACLFLAVIMAAFALLFTF